MLAVEGADFSAQSISAGSPANVGIVPGVHGTPLRTAPPLTPGSGIERGCPMGRLPDGAAR